MDADRPPTLYVPGRRTTGKGSISYLRCSGSRPANPPTHCNQRTNDSLRKDKQHRRSSPGDNSVNIGHDMVTVGVQTGADCPMFILPNPHFHTIDVACIARTWCNALALRIIVLVGAVALAIILLCCCSCSL